MAKRVWLGMILASSAALVCAPAGAQGDEEEPAEEVDADAWDAEPAEGDSEADDSGDSETLGEPADEYEPEADDEAGMAPETVADEQAILEEEEAPEETVDPLDPHEEEGVDYFFLGAMYRQVIIPGFIQQPFVQGGIDGFNPGVGLTFNWRKDNFNILAEVWWNNASGAGFFRANGDPITDMEHIQVDLFVVFVNASFLWSFPITDWFAIELGFDIGVGFIGGSLTRNEAYQNPDGTFSRCNDVGDPDAAFCEGPRLPPTTCFNANGGHYDCEEPNWFTEGGDTPFIVPWITVPHLAVRFKPIRQLQIRIDGGYGIYNFFFGATAMFGF